MCIRDSYCHHHSKGDQGNKDAKDRASGSGVFARDPDAQLDMIELQLDGDMKYEAEAFGRTAWRLESSLREFPNIIPVDFWFDYPIHTLARPEELTQAPAKGSVAAKIRGGKNCSRDERAERIQMCIRDRFSGRFISSTRLQNRCPLILAAYSSSKTSCIS